MGQYTRVNQFKAEMNSQEYKNYVGRAGRLGKSSDKKGQSYLLAPTQAKANDYWNRYINAKEVKIQSALRKLSQKEQVPFFFNLIDANAGANNYIDVLQFNLRIQKTMAYCEEKNPDNLPGEVFIKYLMEYGLIESEFGRRYSKTRIGNELSSYALSLESIEIIMFTCQIFSTIAEKEFKNNTSLKRSDVLQFIEEHYLDILFCLSKTDELENVFIYRLDETAYTMAALEYAKRQQHKLSNDFPLKKIVEDVFENNKPIPSLSNSFALKRAICMIEWMNEKSLHDIRENTGLSYIALGDLDRLGDVFAYIWEAMARILPVFFFRFVNYKIMLMRLAGRLKYGLGQNLIVLASRHVQYVTRNQLIELKKEADLEHLSPEQYVRNPYYTNKQRALRTKQFQDLAKELNEHYSSAWLNNIITEANKLKQADVIDNESYLVLKDIHEQKELTYLQIASLFKVPNYGMNINGNKNLIVNYKGKEILLHILDIETGISLDAFRATLRLLEIKKENKNIFLIRGDIDRNIIEEARASNYVFISTLAFAKLYLLSLKKSSSLSPFFDALYCGYFFIPDNDIELGTYITNFIPENDEITLIDDTKECNKENIIKLHVVQDKVKCNKKVKEIINSLKKKLLEQEQTLLPHYILWSDDTVTYANDILKDNLCVLMFIDYDFENEIFTSMLAKQLASYIGTEKKILMLYWDEKSKDLFLQKYAPYRILNSVCLDKEINDNIIQMIYEVLIKE